MSRFVAPAQNLCANSARDGSQNVLRWVQMRSSYVKAPRDKMLQQSFASVNPFFQARRALVYYPPDLSDALGAPLAEEEGAAEYHVLAVVLRT